MSKLFELSRRIWLEAELAAPPTIQRTVIPSLREAKEIVRLLLRPYLTVYQWQGQGSGGPLVVNYAGTGDARLFLKSRLFSEEPAEIELDQIPFWRSIELANLSTGDITIIEANRHLIHQLPTRNALVLPTFVEMLVDVQGNWEDVKSRFRKSVRKEWQRVKKYGYQCAVSYDDQDFETFFYDMYIPTMKNRHGAQTVLMPKHEAYQYFRHGLLFLVERAGQRVCGGICYLDQDTVRFIVVGVINGDQGLYKEGAIGALNYLRIQWANQSGYKAVDLGYCRPFMTTLFPNKQKWGTAVRAPLGLKQQIWIKLQRDTPAVYQFMKDNPCLVMSSRHELYWLVTTSAPETAKTKNEIKWRKQFEAPGLKGLLIRSMDDFFEKPVGAVNVDPATSIIF